MPEIITLNNQARLIHNALTHTEIVHCGLLINAGSRDENKKNNGVAHFIEHTVFKGTAHRKSHHILTFIEKVGGELNAYTTREKTCYYVSCLKEYADKAVDILCDIAFAASFPEKEIQKEKQVILEEIEMYDDSPDESIYDHFYELLFPDAPMGFNILGTKKTVKGLKRENINTFRKQHYTPSNTILSIVGNISLAKSEKLAGKYLSGLSNEATANSRKEPVPVPIFDVIKKKDFSQAHCMIGGLAYSKHDPKRYALSLVNNILGGSGMSSKLNMSVREKYGLTYQIGSNYSTYQDTGTFSIYFAAEKKNIERCRELVIKELWKLCRNKLSPGQLRQAKTQLKGQVALMNENQSLNMQTQAKILMDYGKYIPYQNFLNKINEVTAEEVLEICNEIINPEKLNTLVYTS